MAIDNTAGQVSGIPTPEQVGQARDILAMARLIRRNKASGYDTATLKAALRTMIEIYHDLPGWNLLDVMETTAQALENKDISVHVYDLEETPSC